MSDRAAPTAPDILATEVFSAIQGEAALVGERQVFIRLTGCNIRCAYCDQPEALDLRPGTCRIERTPGRRDWQLIASPLPISSLIDAAEQLCRRVPHHSISLTGGEPLMQSRRVTELARGLAESGRAVMLETNGTMVSALERILPWTTYVSMDLKLPSVDDERVSPDTQRAFLRTALAAGKTVWAKIVVGASTDPGQLDAAVEMVVETGRETGHEIEIFLQPVTPFGSVGTSPTPDQVLDLQERALNRHPRVRVVPQTHKAIGQL